MQTENTNTMATGRITKQVIKYINDMQKKAKQMDKVLSDIEKLKDANREYKYNGNGKNN